MVGFSFDESYDVVAARSVALGYLDHPPLAMWLIAGAVRLFGSEAGLVVRLPTLLLFAGTTWFVYRLTRLLFTPRAARVAALALNLSPLFGVFAGTIAVTDGPLLFGLSGAGYFLAKGVFGADNRTNRRAWVLSGLFFGIAALAKYSAFLAVPGVLLFLVSVPRHRSWLARPEPYLAAVVALLVFSPAILWNYDHGWTSFVFQGKRAALDGGIHPIRLAGYLALYPCSCCRRSGSDWSFSDRRDSPRARQSPALVPELPCRRADRLLCRKLAAGGPGGARRRLSLGRTRAISTPSRYWVPRLPIRIAPGFSPAGYSASRPRSSLFSILDSPPMLPVAGLAG